MLKIWGRANSINVQKVLWSCAELGLEFERVDAGLEFGVNKTPEYLALNPNGLVPTIEDDGHILWESNSIVRYLSARHGVGTLWVEDIQARSLCERWMDWQLTTLAPAMRVVFQGLIRTPPEERDNDAIAAAQRSSERLFKLLDRHMDGREYIEIDRLTVGDVPVGAFVYRWLGLGNSREDYPNLAKYHDRLAERPGFRDHVMLPLS
jgi:glutathione S-transferase